MDLSGAVPVITMLSGVVTALRDAKELAKDSDDLELKEKISGAYTAMLELSARLYELEEDNRQLK